MSWLSAEQVRKFEDAYHARVKAILEQREEILEAFIAKYGADPDRMMQVVQNRKEGCCWYVRRMTDEEMEQRSSHYSI